MIDGVSALNIFDSGGPLVGVIPPGFAGKANLTIPLVTLLGIADDPRFSTFGSR